jgi:hypothetical protein
MNIIADTLVKCIVDMCIKGRALATINVKIEIKIITFPVNTNYLYFFNQSYAA